MNNDYVTVTMVYDDPLGSGLISNTSSMYILVYNGFLVDGLLNDPVMDRVVHYDPRGW